MFYNARWVDVSLGRFAQADTIIPGIGNPQAWDHYAYGLNNPSRYTDPTGHVATTDSNEAGCNTPGSPKCILDKYAGASTANEWRRDIELYYYQTAYPEYDASIDPYLVGPEKAAVLAPKSRGGCVNGSWWDCFAMAVVSTLGSWSVGPVAAGGSTPLNNNPVPKNLVNDVYSNGGWVSSFPSEHATNFTGAPNPSIYGPGRQLYRLHSGNAGGSWWTTVPPKSEIQFRVDYAHRPEWGTVDNMSTLTVPDKSFTEGWEGSTSYQGDFYVGGATQVYLPYVNPQWITTIPFP